MSTFVLLSFIFGLIVGSFLNVVIYRLNTGRSVARGRSQCLHCSHPLAWRELLPVLSYLAQLGRCRHCAGKISLQYPLVELMTAVIFALGAAKWWPHLAAPDGVPSLVIFWLVTSLLIAIAAYDFRHKIIPNGLVYAFNLLALVLIAINYWPTSTLLWPNIFTGLALWAAFALLWLVSGGRWMGFGDSKLALGIGLYLGPSLGFSAIILAFWLGAAVGLILIFTPRLIQAHTHQLRTLLGRAKSFTIKSEVPFAPFLILGFFLAYLFNLNVLPF